jgi:sortase B
MKAGRTRAGFVPDRLLWLLLVLCAATALFAAWQVSREANEGRASDAQAALRPSLPPVTEDAPLMSFSGLQAKNPDIAAWLVIEGLDIDYPVVQGKDNSYYLSHTAERQANRMGALFLDVHSSRDFSEFYSVIYGHNTRSRRMFGPLERMKDADTFTRVRDGLLYTPAGTYRLEFFAVAVTSGAAGNAYYRYIFPDEAAKGEQLALLQTDALLYREAGVTESDRLLALSTCSYEYEDARTIVFARLAAYGEGAGKDLPET